MAEPLTILTWFWQQPGGRATYLPEHVNIWADMVRRNISLPHRIACVTEHAEGIDPSIAIIKPPGDFEDIVLPTWNGDKPQCLRRIAMFRRDAGDVFGQRFVSMDMDCIVSASLDSLFQTTADFKMYRGGHSDRPYNGSMLMMTAGARPQVYERFNVGEAITAGQRYAGSDQAWISYVLGWGEETWSADDGVLWWGEGTPYGVDRRLMFFPGRPKPWQIAELGFDRVANEHYRRDPWGRCLVLGYGVHLWPDVNRKAIGKFDAVISSPEAAEHWPGKIFAIARDDDHADRIAKIHGFNEVVFCGRSERAVA